LGPVQPVRAGRRQVRLPGPIELVLDPLGNGRISLRRRPARVRRRHHAGAQLLDDLLPLLAIGIQVGDVERLERQIRDALDVVVTIDAVLSDRRAGDVLAGRSASGNGRRNAADRPPKRYPLHSPSSGRRFARGEPMPERPFAGSLLAPSGKPPNRPLDSEMVARSSKRLQALKVFKQFFASAEPGSSASRESNAMGRLKTT